MKHILLTETEFRTGSDSFTLTVTRHFIEGIVWSLFFYLRKKHLRICVFTFAPYFFIFIYVHVYYYQHQEIRFRKDPLSSDHVFQFVENFEEFNLKSSDNANINAVLFKTPHQPAKGVILYFHGNAGNVSIYDKVAREFFRFSYDFLVFDYRGYGKSTGITSEDAFYADSQMIYDHLKSRYKEDQIHLMGHSFGAAIAANVASRNNPQSLMLVGPLHSIEDAQSKSPWFFPKVTEYEFRTDLYVKKTKCPTYIFSGNLDIIHEASVRLSRFLKKRDKFIKINGANHTDIFFYFEEFKLEVGKILLQKDTQVK